LRFAEQLGLGLTPVVIYLGDHDPSGIEMTEDVINRLELYAGKEIEVRRIALTMKQVRTHRPRLPSNFVKEKDANLGKYRDEFGTSECWELDALAPDEIANLITTEVEKLIDAKKWAAAEKRERKNKAKLTQLAQDMEEEQ